MSLKGERRTVKFPEDKTCGRSSHDLAQVRGSVKKKEKAMAERKENHLILGTSLCGKIKGNQINGLGRDTKKQISH